jgi:serine/threonine-protein kinase HipA
VGDVQVVPAGEPPQRHDALVQVGSSWDEVVFGELLDAADVVDPVALAGVQDKASARMISVPVARAGFRYILKVSPPEYPLVVENEAYFIGVARSARFPTVHAEVIRDATGRSGLLVQRFDRTPDDGGTRCLAVEDAAQALNIYPADKYGVSTEQVCTALSQLCPARVVAVRDVFRQVCFAWLTGNGDLHAKNLSVLQTQTGEWRISPAYDLPSTIPYGDTTLALPIAGKRTGVSRKRLIGFAVEQGLPEPAAIRVLEDVLQATGRVPEDIAQGVIALDPNALRGWAKELRHRRRAAQ